MTSYEEEFEGIREESIVISDMIEQIIQLNTVLARHEEYGSKGLEYEQYKFRKREFTTKLNELLSRYKLKLVQKEVA